jgi:deoxyhypusine synthase
MSERNEKDVKKAVRDHANLADGFSHGLEPLEPLDLRGLRSAEELVRAMGRTAFGGRRLGEAAEVLHRMAVDRDCFVVATVSGAMTVAKMGLLLCEMIERGMVQAVVATGALMAHGFVEAVGRAHFKYDEGMDDRELFAAGYDRVYDTLELERNLDDVERILRGVLEGLPEGATLSSHRLLATLGEELERRDEGRSVLRSALACGVPVYVPAFTDSELGLDLAIANERRRRAGRTAFPFDPFLDLEHFARAARPQKRLGIFTIGGGVPRNWAQQLGPYLEILSKRLEEEVALHRYRYGVRVCPEPVHWGGLSGCTYSEGVSWGKFVPREEGGAWAEVLTDATVAWPLLLRAVLDRLEREGREAGCDGPAPPPPLG